MGAVRYTRKSNSLPSLPSASVTGENCSASSSRLPRPPSLANVSIKLHPTGIMTTRLPLRQSIVCAPVRYLGSVRPQAHLSWELQLTTQDRSHGVRRTRTHRLLCHCWGDLAHPFTVLSLLAHHRIRTAVAPHSAFPLPNQPANVLLARSLIPSQLLAPS